MSKEDLTLSTVLLNNYRLPPPSSLPPTTEPLNPPSTIPVDASSIPLTSLLTTANNNLPQGHTFDPKKWALDYLRYAREAEDRQLYNEASCLNGSRKGEAGGFFEALKAR